jgi:hypothetical protein
LEGASESRAIVLRAACSNAAASFPCAAPPSPPAAAFGSSDEMALQQPDGLAAQGVRQRSFSVCLLDI